MNYTLEDWESEMRGDKGEVDARDVLFSAMRPKAAYLSTAGRIYIAILVGWVVALLAAFVFPETTGYLIYKAVESVRAVMEIMP